MWLMVGRSWEIQLSPGSSKPRKVGCAETLQVKSAEELVHSFAEDAKEHNLSPRLVLAGPAHSLPEIPGFLFQALRRASHFLK